METQLERKFTMTNANILIVEGERSLAEDLESSLCECGYAVCGRTGSGEEAVRKAAMGRVDLVLMDIRLEGEMDGIEAAHRIKNERNIPVVFLSAFSDLELLHRVKEVAPYGYLVKPCHPSGLRAAIEVALSKFELEEKLLARNRLLEQANAELNVLWGMLPVCSHCKAIRNEDGTRDSIETYIEDRSNASYTHSICPECAKKYYPEYEIFD